MSSAKWGLFCFSLNAVAELSHRVLWSQYIDNQPEKVANCDGIGSESDPPNFRSLHLTDSNSA